MTADAGRSQRCEHGENCLLCPLRASLSGRSRTTDLQVRAATWHARRFSSADAVEVALKACAEVGEFAEAVGSRTTSAPNPRGDVLEEAADVVIALLVVAGRWTEGDLLDAVAAKLDRLENPASGHRSAALSADTSSRTAAS